MSPCAHGSRSARPAGSARGPESLLHSSRRAAGQRARSTHVSHQRYSQRFYLFFLETRHDFSTYKTTESGSRIV